MPPANRGIALAVTVLAVVTGALSVCAVRAGSSGDTAAEPRRQDGPRGAGALQPAEPSRAVVARPLTAYDRAVIADRPSFYWPLDEPAGPIGDLTGHAYGSTESTGRLGVPGVSGTAVFFDGGAQRIVVPPAAPMQPTGSFSMEMWLKPSGPAIRDIGVLSLGRADRGDAGTAVAVSSHPTRRVRLTRTGMDLRTSRGLTTDRYRHLVFTHDARSGRWRWYVDGTPDAGGRLAAATAAPGDSGLRLGGPQIRSAEPAGGLSVDALSIYPRALPARRVASHYAAAAGVQSSGRHVGGVAVGGLQPWNGRRGDDYRAMRRANMTWLRSDIGWQYVEPSPGRWNWRPFDDVVRDATAAGLNYLAILHTVPGWANGHRGDYAPPSEPDRLTGYCYRTARRYIPLGVTEYQVGNEINLVHPGWPAPDGATYVRSSLIPCVTGVRRAARELGTAATVVLGSLAPPQWTGGADPVHFLTAVYRSGGRGYFDAASWHPYTGADRPGTSRHMVRDPRRLHAVMAAHGDGSLDIWATEFGYPTGGTRAVSENRQAAYAKAAIDVWYGRSFAGPLLWYSGRDTGTDAGDREQHFGLLRHDGSAKRAYAAVAARLTR